MVGWVRVRIVSRVVVIGVVGGEVVDWVRWVVRCTCVSCWWGAVVLERGRSKRGSHRRVASIEDRRSEWPALPHAPIDNHHRASQPAPPAAASASTPPPTNIYLCMHTQTHLDHLRQGAEARDGHPLQHGP